MAEPTNNELLVHLVYIRESVDDLKDSSKVLEGRVDNQEGRIIVLEQNQGSKRSGMWGAVGGILGGILSSFVGKRL